MVKNYGFAKKNMKFCVHFERMLFFLLVLFLIDPLPILSTKITESMRFVTL